MKKSLYIVNDGKHDKIELTDILINSFGYTIYQAEQINMIYYFNNICFLKHDSEKKLVDFREQLDRFEIKNVLM
ncbi:MAG: hypothetical protein H8E98_03900 [Bacteroidetes bacterium]|nr:hypothetical protein [Bacteroidota bacterium]